MLTRRRRSLASLAMAAFILLAACQTDPPASPEPAGRLVAEGLFGSVAWTTEGLFAAMAGLENPTMGFSRIVMILDDGSTSPIALKERTGCRLNRIGSVTMSLEGQLVYTTGCTGPESAPQDEIFDVRSLDPVTGQDRPLAEGLAEGVGRVSWDPATSMGFAGIGDTRCAYVVQVSGAGLAPLSLTATVDGVTWSNDPDEQATSVDGCSTNGANSGPSLSLDGKQLASFGRPPGGGKSWALLLVSPTGGKARVLVSGLSDPATAAWSPDGNRIAIVAAGRGSSDRAVWLFDLGTKEMELFVSNASGFVAWSPDGTELLVASRIGDFAFPQPTALTIYEVP